jgi:hypothetical protein
MFNLISNISMKILSTPIDLIMKNAILKYTIEIVVIIYFQLLHITLKSTYYKQ